MPDHTLVILPTAILAKRSENAAAVLGSLVTLTNVDISAAKSAKGNFVLDTKQQRSFKSTTPPTGLRSSIGATVQNSKHANDLWAIIT